MGFLGWLRRVNQEPAPNGNETGPEPSETVPRDSAPVEVVRERSQSPYITPDIAKEVLILGPDGMPPLHLERRGAELWLVTDSTRHLVPPKNGNLRRLGIYAFGVRGSSHYAPAVKAGNFSAGQPVALKREPDNQSDTNAVAICAHGSNRRAGYVNKQKAAALAKRLDAGETLSAVALRGSPPGSIDGGPFSVLVTTPEILSHLEREL